MALNLRNLTASQGVQARAPILRPAKSFGMSFSRAHSVISAPIENPTLLAHAIHMMSTRSIATSASAAPEHAQETNAPTASSTLLCTSLTAATVEGMLSEAQEAVTAGADIVELRIDYLETFNPQTDLPKLLQECPLPSIVTYRPNWGG